MTGVTPMFGDHHFLTIYDQLKGFMIDLCPMMSDLFRVWPSYELAMVPRQTATSGGA